MSRDLRIPDAEADVLGFLYRAGEATAREVRDALARQRPMAHGTTLTLLSRLEARGLVRRRKGNVGKAFLFSPARDHGSTFGAQASRLVSRAFGGKPVALIASLFETRRPTDAELDEIEALLDAHRRGKRSGRGAGIVAK